VERRGRRRRKMGREGGQEMVEAEEECRWVPKEYCKIKECL
jgi:hypothetical protein